MASSNGNEPLQSQQSWSTTILWLLLIGLASAGGVLYFLDDKLGAGIMIPIAIGAIMGYRSGAWKMFSMLLGSICGFYFAVPTADILVPLLESRLGWTISSSGVGLGVSGFVAGTLATVLSLTFGWIVTSRFLWLKSLDQNLGMIVGTTKSLALIAIGLWTVLAMEPRMIKMRGASAQADDTPGSLYHRFLSVGEATRKSPCLRYLVAWNPIRENATLNVLLNKTESMVRDAQIQYSAAQSGKLPASSKLTSMFSELQRQNSASQPSAPEPFSIDSIGSIVSQLVEGQWSASK